MQAIITFWEAYMIFSSTLKEFRDFALKGNVADMAIGIIIGAAFGKIVTSLVNDVITPPLGMLIGGVDFKDLKFVLKEAEGEFAAVTLNYGNFIQTILDFLIVAVAISAAIKVITILKKITIKEQEAQAEASPEAPSKEEQLLTEIRDIIRDRK